MSVLAVKSIMLSLAQTRYCHGGNSGKPVRDKTFHDMITSIQQTRNLDTITGNDTQRYQERYRCYHKLN